MATEVLGFNDKEMRDEQYRRWKAEGSFGLARYSTYADDKSPQIVYVVTRAEPVVSSCPQMDIRPEVMEIARKVMANRRDLLNALGDTNGGQDSVQDGSNSGGGNIPQNGESAEGDTKGPDSDFRDWSA